MPKQKKRSLEEKFDMIGRVFGLRKRGNVYIFNEYKSSIDGTAFSQKDVMSAMLENRDVLAIIPTGGGKSICFQGPAILQEGITMVITPLVSLIDDQVRNFNAKAGMAYKNGYIDKEYRAIYPNMDDMSNMDVFEEILHPSSEHIEYKLLYLSPERLARPKFRRMLVEMEDKGLNISLVIVDEAHCISQWGFDFRESYLRIINFLHERKKRPVVGAFTATATPQDVEYIEYLLDFRKSEKRNKYRKFISIVPRNNLEICIRKCDEGSPDPQKRRLAALYDILQKRNKSVSTIIYCTTVVQVKYLYKVLAITDEKLDVSDRSLLCTYYGRMKPEDKQKSMRKFCSKKRCCIMIATKAFGMGIDKDDIGLIIHYDVPRSLEDYYQEVGRAGRKKGLQAKCILLVGKVAKDNDQEAKNVEEDFKNNLRGTVEYTLEMVVRDTEDTLSLEMMPIESRLSYDEKMTIQNLRRYRFQRVWYMVKHYVRNDPQNYIVNYLNSRIDTDFKDLGHVDEKLLHTTIDHLRKLISGTNDLYINNTRIANILRWHPDSYELNEPCELKITKWEPIDGEEDEDDDSESSQNFGYEMTSRTISFTINGKEKLTYFDMCVADAVYSIAATGAKIIYVKTIWEVLSGDTDVKFSRADSNIKKEIEESIQRMINTWITITDEIGIDIVQKQFINIRRRSEGELGYDYIGIAPLYRYAEDINGEIISIPVSLLAVHMYEKNCFKPVPLISDDGTQHKWKATIENAVLAHYLLHRISIYRKSNRSRYLNFSTIRNVLQVYLGKSMGHGIGFLNQKILSILLYYNTIGYMPKKKEDNDDEDNDKMNRAIIGYADKDDKEDNRKKRECKIINPIDLDPLKDNFGWIDHGIYVEYGIKLSQLYGIIL